jgi:hypothetical protein
VSLGLDQENVEKAAEDLLELDACDATADDKIDVDSVIQCVLGLHNLLPHLSDNDDDDAEDIPTIVGVEQANRAIKDLIDFFSRESSL